MARKLKLYLDTSVLNYLFADHLPFEKKTTERLLPKRTHLLEVVVDYNLIPLDVTEEIEKLARVYIKAGAMNPQHKNDAFHIATATVFELEALVSWNMDHIVRLKTKEAVDKVNGKLGYPLIYICTPQEVV